MLFAGSGEKSPEPAAFIEYRLSRKVGFQLVGGYPPVVMAQMSAMRNCDLSPRIAELGGLPTLVIGATLDRIARPEMVHALSAGIPGARLVEFPDAAHALPIQLAADVNALLVGHFDCC